MKISEDWWADTIKNPKDLPDFGCRKAEQAAEKSCEPCWTSGARKLADSRKISH